MESSQAKKLMQAVEATGIEKYSFDTDVTTNYYHDGKTCLAIPDFNLGGIHAVKKNGFAGPYGYFESDKKCCYYFSDFTDVHEFRTAGDPEQIKAFLEFMGLSVSDEQVKVLKWMEESSNDLVPITGDYTFKKLTQEEYDALDDEAKEKYDNAKKQHDLEKAGISGKASISVQLG